MFVIMALKSLKNLRRRDLRLNPNHVELGPHIARLAWARESKAGHRVSALSGEPRPPQARSDPGKAGVPRQGGSEAARRVDALEAGDYDATGLEEVDLAERLTQSLLEDASGGY